MFPEWERSKTILVILAHPDDPEFFLGGTIAEWVKQGHEVSYLLLTMGQRGVSPQFPDPSNLITRMDTSCLTLKPAGRLHVRFEGHALIS